MVAFKIAEIDSVAFHFKSRSVIIVAHKNIFARKLGQFTRNYTQTVKRAADNKRRYASDRGIAPVCWGVSKGGSAPFGTRLCEAKCSVLYALSALP